MPKELVVEQTANTVLLVLEWSFLRGQRVARENALAALTYLLGPIA